MGYIIKNFKKHLYTIKIETFIYYKKYNNNYK